jgi:SAM-dependent methyltransferase
MPPPPNGEVRRALELGGGPGHVAHHFALAGFAIQSFTPDESARHDREQRRIATTVGDFHLVQARGGTFDLLVADHALQRCRAPLPALWEWKRLLRTDGYLIVMARLALNRPAPHPALQEPAEADVVHLGYLAYGIAGHVTTLSYWQLRWLFRQVGFQLIVETLEDPMTGSLESVEHVDGRRSADPTRAWNAFFLLRRPGRLPYDGALEKPRPIVR